jgi:hypothetical protein
MGVKEKELLIHSLLNLNLNVIESILLLHLQTQNYIKMFVKRKVFNINGSLTSIILCNLENKFLLNAVQYLMSKLFKGDVIEFDACMIRKEEDKEITTEPRSLAWPRSSPLSV